MAEVSRQLPQEIYLDPVPLPENFQTIDSKAKVPLELGRISIAGFSTAEVLLPPFFASEVGMRSQFPYPLLLLDGKFGRKNDHWIMPPRRHYYGIETDTDAWRWLLRATQASKVSMFSSGRIPPMTFNEKGGQPRCVYLFDPPLPYDQQIFEMATLEGLDNLKDKGWPTTT